MKKGIILSLFSVALLSACGTESEKTETKTETTTVETTVIEQKVDLSADMCNCMEKFNEMKVELDAAMEDEALILEIDQKYANDKAACEEVGKALEAEMQALSDEDKMKKFQEMAADCPAMAGAL